jgi:glucokinase
VLLQNDTALVGLGEAHFGAGRGFSILGYITISTGVGGVRIADGAIEKSAFGFEPGHHLLTLNGKTMELEDIISGATLEKEYHQVPTDIKNDELWTELHKILAQELYNITLDWSPECIVLGGSLVKEGGFDVEHVQTELRALNKVLPKLPTLKRAELGVLGGLYGGLIYIRQHTLRM